jgi:hypothetical protein
MKELASVGCPSWEDPPIHDVTVYSMVLDAGPDNQSFLRRVSTSLTDTPNVMFLSVFCMMHQCHLITKGMLKILDNWDWVDESYNLPVGYFSGVSAIANLWRGTGNPGNCAFVREPVTKDFVSDVQQAS